MGDDTPMPCASSHIVSAGHWNSHSLKFSVSDNNEIVLENVSSFNSGNGFFIEVARLLCRLFTKLDKSKVETNITNLGQAEDDASCLRAMENLNYSLRSAKGVSANCEVVKDPDTRTLKTTYFLTLPNRNCINLKCVKTDYQLQHTSRFLRRQKVEQLSEHFKKHPNYSLIKSQLVLLIAGKFSKSEQFINNAQHLKLLIGSIEDCSLEIEQNHSVVKVHLRFLDHSCWTLREQQLEEPAQIEEHVALSKRLSSESRSKVKQMYEQQKIPTLGGSDKIERQRLQDLKTSISGCGRKYRELLDLNSGFYDGLQLISGSNVDEALCDEQMTELNYALQNCEMECQKKVMVGKSGQYQAYYYLVTPDREPILLTIKPVVGSKLFDELPKLEQFNLLSETVITSKRAISVFNRLLTQKFTYVEQLHAATRELVELLNQTGVECEFSYKTHAKEPQTFSVSLELPACRSIQLKSIPLTFFPPEAEVLTLHDAVETERNLKVEELPTGQYVKCKFSELDRSMKKHLNDEWEDLIHRKESFYEPFNQITGITLTPFSEDEFDELANKVQDEGWEKGIRCRKKKTNLGISYYMYLVTNPLGDESEQQKNDNSEHLLVSVPTDTSKQPFEHRLFY